MSKSRASQESFDAFSPTENVGLRGTKAALKTHALQTLTRGLKAHGTRGAFGVRASLAPLFPWRPKKNPATPNAKSNLLAVVIGLVFLSVSAPGAVDANRLIYLDEFNPFYPGLHTPKLTTPQWVGEEGVEAVVILSIDDMSASQKYETVLRPILERLKKIDGRAPLSIFCISPNPDDPQLQTWLKEGLSLEVHTLTHPCPCLAKGNFAAAANTFHGCVDLLNRVPGNKPAAYRMPCCDSINSPSPRFYAEIFNRVSANNQFLGIDTSMMNISTTNDSSLPRELTVDADGREKFRKYVPFPSFTANIDDYPFPYQIGQTIWEFPCAVPSDWEGQNCFKTNNHPNVVADWKSAIDATVLKRGVFTLVFHPHGWIQSTQIVDLIDYAVGKYGDKIKFLNFREAQERLNKNLLAGQSLRGADGRMNGIRLMDLNNDGFMDVVIGNNEVRKTRVWDAKQNKWNDSDFPIELVTDGKDVNARFGIIQRNGFASMIIRDEKLSGAWDFDGTKWRANNSLLNGLETDGQPVRTRRNGADAGVRFRDVNNDGYCELIVANETQNAVFSWSNDAKKWKELPFALPDDVRITDATGRDLGTRFVDVNEDGFADVLMSNEKSYSLHLFLNKSYVGLPRGWSEKIRSGKRGDRGEIPMIVRGGDFPNNGAWFRNRCMWVQNEDTSEKTNIVDRLSFDQMLALEAPPPKSPQESLATIKVRSGFKIELVASEPLIESPVAFEWGADGKLWVLEMGDYPLGVDGKGGAGGRVRFLEDTNGDGIYDKSTLFMEGLKIPSGLYPWRNGVLVLAAPDLIYAEDTDGDGKADVKKVLFTGFNPGNPQHRANGFDYGLDNWLYGANGDSGGRVASKATGKTVDINGRDFRFRPDTGEFETESGQTQYGRHRNDWDDWFGTNNPNWLWHYLFPERYIARNPHLPVRENKKYLANYDDSLRVFAISEPLERFNDPNGLEHVTSGCSVMPYRDDLFGPDFATSAFTCEPVHNIVHREVIEPDGTTFKSQRAAGEEQSEFIASTDNWFRPVMVKTGPDGALYVADIYRLVIEHPEWISADRQKRIDLRAGADKGRIYRVYPENAKVRPIPNLAMMNTVELVAALNSPNGWQRDTAQRILVDKQDKSAIEPLNELVTHSAHPKSKVQALGTLAGLSALTSDYPLFDVLKDSDPHVREFAVRAYEPELKRKKAVQVHISSALADDPEIRVRYQLALSLGETNDRDAGRELAKIALRDWNDPQMQIAVMSSATKHVDALLTAVLAAKDPPSSLVEQLFSLATALDSEKVFGRVLRDIAAPADGKFTPRQFAALAGFLDALERKGKSLAGFYQTAGSDLKNQIAKLEPLFAAARETVDSSVSSRNANPSLLACRLLGRGLTHQNEDIVQLSKLLSPTVPAEIQTAAMTSLKKIDNNNVAEVLLSNWQTLGPNLKAEAVTALLSRSQWLDSLLVALEKGTVPPAQIGTVAQQKLLANPDAKIKARASKLFAVNADRQKVLQEYAQVESLKGDPKNGRVLFVATCAQCHRFRDEGNQVGPDLAMMADKPVSDFLQGVLNPNQAIEARYLSYTATTKNGREVTGVISTETANSITLKMAGGSEETILRSDLEELKSGGLSLMPEGFENALKPQAMADLISYLKSKRLN